MKHTNASVSPIASVRHTTTMIGVIAVIAVAGAMQPPRVASTSSQMPLYLSAIAAEAGLIYYVVRGTRARASLADVAGRVTPGVRGLAADVAVAAAAWGTWMLIERIAVSADTVSTLLPRGAAASVVWVALSVAAGFAEELAFRGYLMRQLRALTGSAAAAVVLQALVFGIAHGYQGAFACARIVLFGLLTGAIALWRGNIRATAMMHAWTDIFAGLLG